jgi:glycosyltransferase involved in cell wall biosynthesis
VELLASTNFFLLGLSILIFDIPRYTLSLVSLALSGFWRRPDSVPEGKASVSVIIPTFNGGSGLAPTIASLQRQTLQPFEIIVVDDGSTDETAAVVERLAADDARVRVVRRTGDGGVGRALRDGFAAATGRYVLTLDADFALIAPELRDLFDAVAAGHDGAFGSRFSHDSILVNYPFPKIVANRGFHVLLRLLTAVRARDISNNLKLLPDAIYRELVIREDGFAANAEVGLQPLLAGHDLHEIPISWINRTIDMGTSSFDVARAGPGYARVLGRLLRERVGR